MSQVGVKDNGVFWMDWNEFTKGFSDVAVCFDQQKEGRRYTVNSQEAQMEHEAVKWGTLGHQKWQGLK